MSDALPTTAVRVGAGSEVTGKLTVVPAFTDLSLVKETWQETIERDEDEVDQDASGNDIAYGYRNFRSTVQVDAWLKSTAPHETIQPGDRIQVASAYTPAGEGARIYVVDTASDAGGQLPNKARRWSLSLKFGPSVDGTTTTSSRTMFT